MVVIEHFHGGFAVIRGEIFFIKEQHTKWT